MAAPGPSDHKAVTINGRTVMVPIHTAASFESPYAARRPNAAGVSLIERDGVCGRADVVSGATALLRIADVRRYSLFEDCGAAFEGRPGDDGAADLHPLSEPGEDLPVLRDWPITRGWPHHCAQDARAARGSRARGCPARRRQAYGHDDGHAERHRSRRRRSFATAPSRSRLLSICRSRLNASHRIPIAGSNG